jgi:hypothetical protein
MGSLIRRIRSGRIRMGHCGTVTYVQIAIGSVVRNANGLNE